MSIGSVTQPGWVCGACREPIGGEAALRDHHAWCLRDAAANQRLIQEVTQQEGGLGPDALVAAAEQYRLAREEANPPEDRAGPSALGVLDAQRHADAWT